MTNIIFEYRPEMIFKHKKYFYLLINNGLWLLVFYVLSSFDVKVDLLFWLTFISLLLTIYFVSRVYIHYPAERLNPFFLLSIIYTIPFSITIFLARFNKYVVWDELMRHYSNINVNNLINTLCIAYLFSFLTTMFAYIFSLTNVWQKAKALLRLSLARDQSKLIMIPMVITAIELLLIMTGQVTLQGESMLLKNKENLTVNPIFAIINPISCISVFITAYLYGRKREKKWLFLLLVQLIWFFLLGRRYIMYFTILVFWGYLFEQNIKLLIFNFKRLLNVIAVILFLYFIKITATFYHELRIIGGVRIMQNVSFENIVDLAGKYIKSNRNEIAFKTAYNLEIRPFSIVAGVARYDKILNTNNLTFGYGAEIWNSFLKATPSSILVDKKTLPVMEELASSLTTGAIQDREDMGDSLLLESMMDFGYMGVFIYTFLILFAIYIFIYVYVRLNSPLLMLSLLITLLFCIVTMAEGGIAVFFLTLRVNLFIALLFLFINLFQRVFKNPSPGLIA